MKDIHKKEAEALLFINGEMPKKIPDYSGYDIIACTDGSFNFLKQLHFPIDELDFVSGDLDSISNSELILQDKMIFTPDQNFTDFQKALEILVRKNIKKVHVYGGSGREQDHFLGNLNAAFLYKNQLEITFYDEFSKYFFIPKKYKISNVKNKKISLFPFPEAKNIYTKGLKWNLNKENLNIIGRIGTRNQAIDNEITIEYSSGSLLIFIGNVTSQIITEQNPEQTDL